VSRRFGLPISRLGLISASLSLVNLPHVSIERRSMPAVVRAVRAVLWQVDERAGLLEQKRDSVVSARLDAHVVSRLRFGCPQPDD